MAKSAGEGRSALLIMPAGATARSMSEGLAGLGCAVETSDCVFHAISMFTKSPADLVVLGLAGLTDRDLEIIRVIREIRPDVHVIVLLRASQRERAVTALSLGADGYLLEPFYLEEFLAVARRAFHRLDSASPAPRGFEPEGSDLGRLAGAVAHAVNNPLQIIELLLAEGDGSEPNHREFKQETARIQTVVEELLAFARRNQIRLGNVDMVRLVREAVPASRKRGSRIEHDLAEDLPLVRADARLLEAVLKTLAGLAQAKGGNYALEIAVRREGNEQKGTVQVRFHVADLILSSDEAGALFTPFSGPVAGAVGLAAVTAKTAVDLHGGSIGTASTEGEGTTVTISLPIAGPPEMEGDGTHP